MISRMMQGAIATALLALNLSTQAGPPPPPNTTPPDFDKTQAIGGKIQAAAPNLNGWEEELLRDATNYNAYTEAMDNAKIVVKYTKNCKNEKGDKTFACNFKIKGTGDDLLASTLLGPNAYTSDEQRQNALDFVRNLTNITPIAYPGDSTVYKDPDKKDKGLTDEGIAYFAKMFKQLPLLSVTQNSLLALFADRERLPGMATGLPNTVGKDGAASLLEVLEYEATRRYSNPDWFKMMDASSDSATLHEMAYMMAFQNYLLVKSYEQNARMEALMAAQVSALNNMASIMNQSTGSTAETSKSFEKFQ